MKTKEQKEAKEIMEKMQYFYVVELRHNRSDFRVRINGEAYVTIASLGDYTLNKLRRYAKKNGWSALDMFPAKVSCDDYWSLTHLVRVAALKEGGEKLRNSLISNMYDIPQYEEAIRLADSPWPSKESNWRIQDYSFTEEQAMKQYKLWDKRRKLLYTKVEASEPSVEQCISVLKKHGYKIQKPVVQYEEI